MAELPSDPEARLLSLEGMCQYLAWDVCRAYAGALEYEDLLQDAWLGAIDAVSRYDESQGWALSTFAHRRVRGAIIDGIRTRDHLSRSHRQRLRDAGETLSVLSLDADYSLVGARGDASYSLTEVIEDPTASEAFAHIEDSDAVRKAVARLPERMRHVVVEYYWGGRTLADIARSLGVTESRACQIIAKARDWLHTDLRDTYTQFDESPTETPLRALA